MAFVEMAGIEDELLDSEREMVPEGRYDLLIEDAREIANGYLFVIKFDGHPDARDMIHILNNITAEDDEKKAKNKRRFTKAFLKLFGATLEGGYDPDQLVGATAEGVAITQDEWEGKWSNKIDIFQYA